MAAKNSVILTVTTRTDREIVMTRVFGAPRRLVFEACTKPERLISTESFDDYPGESLNTLTFVEPDGKTTFTNTILYASREVHDAVIRSGMERGAGETYDRLAEHL